MSNKLDNCVWIGAEKEIVSPIIYRRFNTVKPKKARLFITGLGYFEAKLNDKPVTDYMFLPVASDYEPRDFKLFAHRNIVGTTFNRTYYYEFDITDLLQEGENLLSVQLGNGWYRQDDKLNEGKTTFGDLLKCIYKIVVDTADETFEIGSDGSETYTDSYIRYSNLYLGETIDYTVKLCKEKPVNILEPAKTTLSEAAGIPDKVIRTISPTKIGMKDGKTIFDAGENITGLVKLKTSAPYGTKITLRFDEVINDDLTFNFDTSGHLMPNGKRQIMTSTYITDGKERTFMPKFTWHAFRYFEVDGEFDELIIEVIHTDVRVTSKFSSNHEGMNFLYDAYLRTQLDNMHGSIPSDCPHRERLGYTGDGQVMAPAVLMTLDVKEFYKKWIQDILDCQDTDGHVRHTAPFMGAGGGPGGWGSAIVTVPYAYYKQYGDTDMLKYCYNAMKLWISYLQSRQENGLITSEDPGGWCLGDWASLEKMQIPDPYVNSCYMVKDLLLLEEIASIIGRNDDIEHFQKIRAATEKSITDTYYDASTGHFAGGIQGADAFAVWCGLAGADTVRRLAEKYESLRYFDTGFLCTDILCEILCDYGYADTMLSLLESEKIGTFLYMKRHGATTIWETFDGKKSNNHPMFSACVRQLFCGILGIRQRKGTAGYEDVIISPVKTKRALQVSGSITTPNGVICVSLDTTQAKPIIKVDAPKNIKVEIVK